MNSSSVIPFPQRNSANSRDKLMPQSLEAEQSTLGAMLMERNAVARAVEILTVDDFYRELHKKIFKSVLRLLDKGEPIDIVTVAEDLRRNGTLQEVGGYDYLSALIEACPSSSRAPEFAQVVKEMSLRRHLIQITEDIQNLAHDTEIPFGEILRRSQAEFSEVKPVHNGFHNLKSVAQLLNSQVGHLARSQPQLTGISTGFHELDAITSGLQPAEFIIVAARPSLGKTALCLNIAHHIALNENQPVAIFSLEMSKEKLVQRFVCSEASIKSQDLRRGTVQDGDWHRITNAVNRLYQAPIFIDDQTGQRIDEMLNKARRLTAEHGQLGLIVVDYLQLAHSSGKSENRVQEISEVARAFKLMARELRCPVIALSQLSRTVEQREDKRPRLSDLKESGAIEIEADLVAFIYRDSYYKRKALLPGPDAGDNTAEVIIAKQRNGPTGTIRLGFQPEYARFTNLAPDN